MFKTKLIINTTNMIKKNIYEILTINESLIFYRIMKYPVPKQYKYYLFEKKEKTNYHKTKYSRQKINPHTNELLKKIYKYKKLYQSLPFIKNIYICNSISFNACNSNSDIDLFIITNNNKIRTARFFSVLFFFILGLKRSLKNKDKKFCLSFYITENNQNLYNISLAKTDVYLIYRIAHLIPLYEKEKNSNKKIYQENKRIKTSLKNISLKQNIFLGNQEIFSGNTKIKNILEKIFNIGFIEYLIKLIRSPIVIKKSKQQNKKGAGIIINDNMLKFHKDIREKIHFLYYLKKNEIQNSRKIQHTNR